MECQTRVFGPHPRWGGLPQCLKRMGCEFINETKCRTGPGGAQAARHLLRCAPAQREFRPRSSATLSAGQREAGCSAPSAIAPRTMSPSGSARGTSAQVAENPKKPVKSGEFTFVRAMIGTSIRPCPSSPEASWRDDRLPRSRRRAASLSPRFALLDLLRRQAAPAHDGGHAGSRAGRVGNEHPDAGTKAPQMPCDLGAQAARLAR